MSVNQAQLLFLFTFTATLATLIFSAHFLDRKLSAAGYDIRNIILIGLEEKKPLTNSNLSEAEMSVIKTIQSNTYAQVFALVVVVTTGVLYRRFVAAPAKRKPVLNGEWQEFKLKQKTVVSPNTAIYRLALPHPQDILGLPIGQHIQVSAHINGKDIQRSYTPTSSDDDLGYFDLLIKSYEKGNVSKYFTTLKIGDSVRVKGPKGQFQYHASLSREIGMIAGGTGITPMLQIIRAALKSNLDQTKLKLIYANVTPEDILLKQELDTLASIHPDRFTVYYVLNKPPENWNGGVGFVSKDDIEKHMPKTHANIKILMCGPPPMMTAMKSHLDTLGYPPPRTISKLVDQVFLF